MNLLIKRYFFTCNSFQTRWNPLGIQMISQSLYSQIFGSLDNDQISNEIVEKSITYLTQHGLGEAPQGKPQPDVNIKLPPLSAKDISSHFNELAETQLKPYRTLIDDLVKPRQLPPLPSAWSYQSGWTRYNKDSTTTLINAPQERALVFDVEVCVSEGHAPTLAVAASPNYWYSWVSEKLINERDYHQRSKVILNDLIPLGQEGEEEERLIVGHFVSYDRARLKEQYIIKNSKTRFLDTLSLHVCVAGQTSQQKLLWWSAMGKRKNNSHRGEEEMSDMNNEWALRSYQRSSSHSEWMNVSCPNGLADVYKLYCGGEEMDKSLRDVFVQGNMSDIRENFQQLMTYCSLDVSHTHKVLQKVYPLFLSHCPHPVTLAGMLEMSTMYLPVNDNWEKFLNSAKYTAEDMELEMTTKLISLANSACSYTHQNKYSRDVWLSNLDWSSKSLRSKCKTENEMTKLLKTLRESSPREEGDVLLISKPHPSAKRRVHKPGYPEWYRKLCMSINESPWQPGPVLISPNKRVVPYLLRIKWAGHPLYYHPSLAWGYVIPTYLRAGQKGIWSNEESHMTSHMTESPDIEELLSTLQDTQLSSEEEESHIITTPTKNYEYPKDVNINFGCGQLIAEEEGEAESTRQRIETEFGPTDDIVILGGDRYYFFKIPHKSGSKANCGNPLSQDYLTKMQSGILTSALGSDGQRILQLNSMGSFWRSNQKRIDNQFVVWCHDEHHKNKNQPQGVILPVTMVTGTVTRRAVEPTWLTASNAKEYRIGSELKSMIQCPVGYSMVGADVDSQEVWIASLLGDQHFSGLQGSTAFSWMTLQGNKTEGTDIHSMTASTIGTTRDQAKMFNYGRIYGAGVALSNMLLKQFNPSLSDEEIEHKSTSLYRVTKGERRLLLLKKGQERALEAGLTLHTDGSVSSTEWFKYFNSRQSRGVVRRRYWHGGTESDMFNKLEEIAKSSQPRTPVLNCLISRALQKENVGDKFMTSRINWVVQSSGVDYLHLLLVATKWLMGYYGIQGQLCISIHDEIRYLVKEEDRYKMAFALQVANIWTRAMFVYQLGMRDLPLSVAFFSAVDIDTVLRKEVTMDCQTPSNPLGLKQAYGIEFGEALNMLQTIEKLKSNKNDNII